MFTRMFLHPSTGLPAWTSLIHSPEMATAWTNLSGSTFFFDFSGSAASAPRVAAKKRATARGSVIACLRQEGPLGNHETADGVSQTLSAGLPSAATGRERRGS